MSWDVCDILWRFLTAKMVIFFLAARSAHLTFSHLYKWMLWLIWMYLKKWNAMGMCDKYPSCLLDKKYTDTSIRTQSAAKPFCVQAVLFKSIWAWCLNLNRDFSWLVYAWWADLLFIIKFHRPLKLISLCPTQDRISLTSLKCLDRIMLRAENNSVSVLIH